MFEFMKKYAEMKKEQHHLAIKDGKSKVNNVTEQMLNTYCPIEKGPCHKECIHFELGGIYVRLPIFGGWVEWKPPKCKLWK